MPCNRGRSGWLWPCVFLLLFGIGPVIFTCSGQDKRAKPPRPPAAKRDVTTGVIVQLRLAVEAFDTVFDMRAPEQDLLPMLVHAWATFYGWEDPTANARARYEFTEKLCRARLPTLPKTRDLFVCMDQLREALLRDLLWATDRYVKAGHPDKVGGYSLGQLRKELALRLKQFQATLVLRQQRRARRQLFEVDRCRLLQPVAPVLGTSPRELSLNGFPVITQTTGAFNKLVDHELEGLRQQLESRLMESQPAGKQPEQLVLALDRRMAGGPLLRLIGLASGLGVSRVCLKVERKGKFTVPCCLPVRLSPKVVRPRPALELDEQGLHRVTEKTRRRIPTDRASVALALKELGAGAQKPQPPLVVLPGAKPSMLIQTIASLPLSTVVEIIPAGVTLTPPKRSAPQPTSWPGFRPRPWHDPKDTTNPAPRPSPQR
jgi:hypothetical protein